MSHSATFTWPPTGAYNVFVTGSFDSWSGSTHGLRRKEDGWFEGEVPIPYGEKVSYKYVVDGQWMTREDEAKEWDAAGNMNNVYTAPHAPAPTPAPAPAPTSEPEPTATPTVITESTSAVPPTSASDPEPISSTPLAKTEPSSLLASAAPGATADHAAVSTTQAELVEKEKGLVGGEDPVHQSDMKHTTSTVAESSTTEQNPIATATSGAGTGTQTETETGSAPTAVETIQNTASNLYASAYSGLANLNLGAPVSSPSKSSATAATTSADRELSPEVPTAADYPVSTSNDISHGSATMPNAAAAAAVSPGAPAATTTSASTTEANTQSIAHEVQSYGVGVLGALGAAAFGAAVVVGDAIHSATGVDVMHKDPQTTDAAAAPGVPAKEEYAAPAPPAKTVSPAPMDSISTSTQLKPDPDAPIAPQEVAPRASLNNTQLPNGDDVHGNDKGFTTTPANGGIASGKYGDKVADVFTSNAAEKNEKYKTDLPAQHETAASNHTSVPQPVITTLSEPSKDRTLPSMADHADKPVSADPAVDAREAKDQASAEAAQVTASGYPLPSTFPVPSAAPAGPEPSRSYIQKDAPAAISGLPLSQTTVPTSGKDAIAPSVPAKTIASVPVAPSTPSKKRNSVFASSPASTAASTPIKPVQGKESSVNADNMRKRKSSFFAKVKSAFSKDKDGK